MRESNGVLLKELSKLSQKGVILSLEGRKTAPTEIIEEFLVNEESNYMRDYILDEEGMLIELGFYKLK